MATRSRIGIQLSDGSVLSAYHHWDGYPEWLGKKLIAHFNTKELASDLIDGGDMSACYTTHTFDSEVVYVNVIRSDGSTFKKSIQDSEGNTIYTHIKEEPSPQYYSERGEDTPPRLDSSIEEYLANGEEYAYLWTDENKWVCYNLHEFDDNEPELISL